MWSSDRALTLEDGRTLGYRTLGRADGLPLFFMHGTPGSRYVLSARDPLAHVPGIFLITPERPGYGLSAPHPGRTLRSWAADVVALADHLGLARYAVAGISGGAPHALACAHYSADRVSNVFMLSSPAPRTLQASTSGMSFGNKAGVWLSKRVPWLVRAAIGSYAEAFKKDPEVFLRKIAAQMCHPDRLLMEHPQLREAMIRDLHEAYRQGSDAQFLDGQLVMGDVWDFPLTEISTSVHLWHGELDTLVPASAASAIALASPRIRLSIGPRAGHLLTEDRSVIAEIATLLQSAAAA